MKVQIRAKFRNQGRDWAVFRHPDEKKDARGLVGLVGGDTLISSHYVTAKMGLNLFHYSTANTLMGGTTVKWNLL
jgi:hypothetical protein